MKTAESSRFTPELVARYPRPGMAVPGKIHYSPDAKVITYLFSERGDLVRELWALDPASGRLDRPIPLPEGAAALATTGDAVWVADNGGDVVRLSP